MLGKLLNNMSHDRDEDRKAGIAAKQRIDGATCRTSKRCAATSARTAAVIHSEKDGWFITGVVLNKEAP